jgi:membrane associated rhomboid family serine protease
MGRRFYRAVTFALIVGVVGAGLAVVPALFVQSIFIGNAQRCEQQQTRDLAAFGEIRTPCAENLNSTPEWLPPSIVVGAGLMGLAGGFGYGFIGPRGMPKRTEDREQSWLPF